MANAYDVIVIGSGPGGYIAAIRAAQLGLKTAIVEREHLAGICSNWGCIPTKALLRSAEIFHYAKHPGDYGVKIEGAVTPDLKAIVARSRGIAQRMNGGVGFLMKKNKVDVIWGEAKLSKPGEIVVSKTTKKIVEPQAPIPKNVLPEGTYTAKHIIVATGARPRALPGIEPDAGHGVGCDRHRIRELLSHARRRRDGGRGDEPGHAGRGCRDFCAGQEAVREAGHEDPARSQGRQGRKGRKLDHRPCREKGRLRAEPPPIIALNDHTTGSVLKGNIARKLPQMAERSGLSQDAYKTLLETVWGRRDEVDGAIAAMARAARENGNVLLAHDEATPEDRLRFRALGARSSEFPLTLETAAEATRHGEHVILGAPNVVRGGSHNGALDATAAIRDGLCTCLASDYHYPSPLHAAFKLAGADLAGLADAWALVSANPAAAAGLEDRGAIETGKRADLLLVDAGRAGHPEVVATFCGGRLVYATRALHVASTEANASAAA
jgi:hypothetical protein